MLVSEHKDSLRQHLISFYNMVVYERSQDTQTGIGPIADAYIRSELNAEEGMHAYFNSLEKISKYNQRILHAIKKVKGNGFYKHLTEFIKDRQSVAWDPWTIVSQPEGEQQSVSEYGREIKTEWVQQWATGTEGDTWDGIICVKIKPGKYLKFHFSI